MHGHAIGLRHTSAASWDRGHPDRYYALAKLRSPLLTREST
jgi:hypothetical protein